MSKVVKFHYQRPGFGTPVQSAVTMPRLCVSCGSPASVAHTMKVSGSSEGKLFIDLSFPLCDRCHEFLVTAGAKPETGYFKASIRVPKELRPTYRQIKHAVQVKPGRDYLRCAFENEAFGQAFEAMHADELSWAEKRRYRKQLDQQAPAEPPPESVAPLPEPPPAAVQVPQPTPEVEERTDETMGTPATLISKDEFTTAKLAELYNQAFMDAQVDSGGNIGLTLDGVKVIAAVDNSRAIMRLASVFGVKPQANRQQVLELCNRINDGLIMVRAACPAALPQLALIVDHFLDTTAGVTAEEVIDETRRFRSVVNGLPQADTEGILA